MTFWNFLRSDRPESSLRVNLFIITLPIGGTIGAIAFHIIWRTVFTVFLSYQGSMQIVTQLEISWSALGLFIGAVLAGYFTLLYGKKINKDAETNQGTKETNNSKTPTT